MNKENDSCDFFSVHLPDGLGQTLGQALKPYSNPKLDGHSVSAGIVVELYIATRQHNLPHGLLLQTLYDIRENYPVIGISCEAYDDVLRTLRMHTTSDIYLRLLTREGILSGAEAVSDDLIKEGIDFYRESYGE